jgi:hypothetical protein
MTANERDRLAEAPQRAAYGRGDGRAWSAYLMRQSPPAARLRPSSDRAWSAYLMRQDPPAGRLRRLTMTLAPHE